MCVCPSSRARFVFCCERLIFPPVVLMNVNLVCPGFGSVEQKAQRRYRRCARMQADPEEGDKCEAGGPHLENNDGCAVRTRRQEQRLGVAAASCSRLRRCASLQRVLGLSSLDGVLNPAHASGQHIVRNVFNVNKSGIVVLENKAGVSSPRDSGVSPG